MATYDRVADAIAAAARTIHHPESLDELLLAIAMATRESIPAFDLIGISTVDHEGNVITRAVTDDRVYELDQMQYGQAEGPCMDAVLSLIHI